MPYRNMSLEDFARHIGMDLRDVQKLAERGKLPGEKISGQWRFNRARVTEWLQQEMHLQSEQRLIEIERAMSGGEQGEWSPGIVTGMMSLNGINLAVRAGSRPSVIREMVGLAERTGLVYDKDGLLEAVMAREELCSTALPNGVAFPHPRQPMPYVSAEPLICFGRAPQGVPFGSPDGILTSVFFLIVSHDDRSHLHVLARLVRILDKDTVLALRDIEQPDEALTLLMRREEQVAQRGEQA